MKQRARKLKAGGGGGVAREGREGARRGKRWCHVGRGFLFPFLSFFNFVMRRGMNDWGWKWRLVPAGGYLWRRSAHTWQALPSAYATSPPSLSFNSDNINNKIIFPNILLILMQEILARQSIEKYCLRSPALSKKLNRPLKRGQNKNSS